MGSTVLTLELADYLQQHGAQVEIFCSEYAEPVRSEFEKCNLTVIDDEDYEFALSDYDYIWVNSQILPLSIVRQLSEEHHGSVPAFIFNHMSALDIVTDEYPYLYGLEESLASLVLSVSPEAELKVLPYFNNTPPHALFPNPAPEAYENTQRNLPQEHPSHVLIVSNHAPQEVLDAGKILEHQGVEVTHFGDGGGERTLVTADNLSQYDAVITIGKTVQYCLTAGIPVYVYDHFGGFGYLNDSNIGLAAHNNFSGRGGSKRSAETIAEEILHGYNDAVAYHRSNRQSFIEQYSINHVLPNLLQSIQHKPLTPFLPTQVLSLISAERLAYRFYRTWAWANFLEDERARLTARQEDLIAKLDDAQTRERDTKQRLDTVLDSHAYKFGRKFMYLPHEAKMLMSRNHKN